MQCAKTETSSCRHWFLILTKPAGEQLAEVELARQGFHVYYPRLQRQARHRGRLIERVVALFPRYLFVRLDVGGQASAPIRSTRGVSNIVRFGEDATIVPDAVVESLMRRADPKSGLHRIERPTLQPGARVNVVGGAFDGLDGIYEREAGDQRSVILLSLLGRNTPVRVSSAFLERAA
ncbi:MAG: transcription termination/antitermination NusG family protein [Pseudomonadota bacterium]